MSIATAIVHASALRHNIEIVKNCAPQSQVIAVVKSNAYGHGLVGAAKLMQHHVDGFGVARLSEAILLRDAGITLPILLLEGFFVTDDVNLCVTYQLDVVIHSHEQLALLQQAKLASPLRIWMKIDTGLHRLGIRVEDCEPFYQALLACENVQKPIHFLTHFSSADEVESPRTDFQISLFNKMTKDKLGMHSLAASCGILFWPESHQDVVRAGAMLYGVSPTDIHIGRFFGLKTAMSFETEVISVRNHEAGEPSGYSETWRSENKTNLAAIAVGYGDGYPRNARLGTPVWINGKLYPLAGCVSMDIIVVDLGLEHDVKAGDRVVLWGEELPVEWIATQAKTSPYELICGLTERVKRVYVDEETD